MMSVIRGRDDCLNIPDACCYMGHYKTMARLSCRMSTDTPTVKQGFHWHACCHSGSPLLSASTYHPHWQMRGLITADYRCLDVSGIPDPYLASLWHHWVTHGASIGCQGCQTCRRYGRLATLRWCVTSEISVPVITTICSTNETGLPYLGYFLYTRTSYTPLPGIHLQDNYVSRNENIYLV